MTNVVERSFPIDLGAYKPLALDPSNPTLTDEQRKPSKLISSYAVMRLFSSQRREQLGV